MRLSQFHLATVKEVPSDAEIASHRLMLRAGMLRKHAAGLYTWSPLGLKVLKKVENIVREEMNRAGALEVIMPTVQPRELWDETGRWQKFGPQLLKIKDRKEAAYCYAPTAEEVVTDFARGELKSYKQLPVNFYQINTKFRDEVRPRFGVMRSRAARGPARRRVRHWPRTRTCRKTQARPRLNRQAPGTRGCGYRRSRPCRQRPHGRQGRGG